jgi:hypothetical protein
MQVFTTRNGGKAHTINPCVATLADEMLPHKILHAQAMPLLVFVKPTEIL